MRPFDGVRVVEFGQFIAAPWCAQLLAQGGARVVKVESLDGDPVRQLAPLAPGESSRFLSRNRGKRTLPLLPQKLSPAQSARLAEILDVLHHQLSRATENIHATEDGTQVTLGFADWQRIQAVEMLLARYVRAIADPDTLES